ncbi:MAG: YjbQ family protein [Deltaproteobacteria bacterium]|nr:YjbQ family protein [Deltaproteobacteria bacterium]
MHYSKLIKINTSGRGTLEITDRIQSVVSESGVVDGLCTVFIQHTSASLIICENADPSVRRDLETYISRLVADGDRAYTHASEGADDMASHIRSVLTQTSIGVPVGKGRLVLGTWQGIYLWEHRYHAHARRVSVTIIGSS